MPLKSRASSAAASSAAEPVTSRKRPADILEEQEEKSPVREVLEEDGDIPATSDDPDGALDSEPEETGDASDDPQPEPTRTKRQYTRKAKPDVGSVDESELDKAKTRISEIGREVKQLRSETTAQIKSIEASANQRLKALRAEHEDLSAIIAENQFSL